MFTPNKRGKTKIDDKPDIFCNLNEADDISVLQDAKYNKLDSSLPCHQFDIRSKIPFPVSVTNAGNFLSFFFFDGKRIIFLKTVLLILVGLQHLLGEIVVDEGGLQSQIPGRIQAAAFFLWWLCSGLTDSEKI